MKDSFLETLCNDSTLHIINKFTLIHHDTNTSSTNLYYLNDCFQQAFLITPLYLFLLIYFSYRLGYLSYRIVTNRTSLENKFWTNLTLTLLSNIFLTQLITFIIIHNTLLYKLTISLKIVTISVYILLVYHYPYVSLHPNSNQLRTVRKALIVIILTSLIECWTVYFDNQPDRLSFILSIISCSLWIFHCLVVFLHSKVLPNDLEDPQLLIDHENNVILECDESYSFLAKLFFTWVSPLLSRGIQTGIDSSEDLFQLPNSLSSHLLDQSVASYLNSDQTRTGSHRLICFIFSKIYSRLLLLGLLKFAADALTISFPIFLNHLLTYLERDTNQNDGNQGFILASLLLASTLFSSIFNSCFNFQMSKISLQVRTILINLLYNKLLHVRSTVLADNFGTGQILNLANTDIERVINLVPSLFQFISLPIQLIITLYLFYKEVQFVFISAVIFIVLLIPINKIICDRITMFSQKLMFWKDKRIETINEILKGIYTIKTHAWETLFREKVQVFRKQEVKYLKYRKYLDALCVYFWATTPVIISSLVFGCYVWFNGAHSLTSSKVFTTLALLSMLIMPLNALPWVLNGLMEALVSLKRLNLFYMLKQIDYNHQDLNCEEEIIFDLNNCSFMYSDLDQFENGHFKLSDIVLSTRKKTLVGLTGKVGSGKSSLIKSLMFELIKTGGIFTMNETCKRGIGYVPQEPWIQDASIRENILFGKEYEPHFYNQIIDACELLPDFQLLPNGDGTLAGNHGATLSGGQKTRIALARALYQNFDVYLIDEPFASLDINVAQGIHRKVFKDILIEKSVILVTNHVEYLHNASFVLLLEHGKITKTIHRSTDHFGRNLAEQQAMKIGQEQDSKDHNVVGCHNTQAYSEENQDQPEEEEREHGTIKFDVYSAYVSSIGYCTFTMIILLICLMQITRSGSDFWLSIWTKDKDSSNTLVYLYVFISIGILNSIITLMRAFIFAYGGVKAAIRIHDQLLECIFKSSLLFFDLISFGIIINRFSSDTFNVDDALPFTLNIFLAQLSSLLISLVITIYGMPWIILIFIMLTIPYYLIQEYFRSTSRELKRIAATALSPIYAQLDDTICGLTVIRTFAQVERFKNQFNDNVNIYNRIQYSIAAVQQWLNLRLQIFGAIITSFVAFTAVILHNYHYQSVNSSFVGLSLVYSLSLTSLLNGSVQAFTQTELDLISVERIQTLIKKLTEFFEIDNIQTCLDIECITHDWPNEGVICFNNVSMRYRDNLDYALKNISFKINSGENVAIVGRTGSGKSSIFRALFKLVNIDQGSIIIDGLDIEKIPRKILRSRLHIIPQDAFIFNGTIRENLDPLNQYRDDEIWTALFQCKINILVDTLGGLYSSLNESGNQLSIGQKHLLCLARAVLNRGKILCMDEITANIDNETAEVLEELIRTVFKETTILHIAHKMDAVRNYDRIIQMNDGSIVNIFESIEQYVSGNMK